MGPLPRPGQGPATARAAPRGACVVAAGSASGGPAVATGSGSGSEAAVTGSGSGSGTGTGAGRMKSSNGDHVENPRKERAVPSRLVRREWRRRLIDRGQVAIERHDRRVEHQGIGHGREARMPLGRYVHVASLSSTHERVSRGVHRASSWWRKSCVDGGTIHAGVNVLEPRNPSPTGSCRRRRFGRAARHGRLCPACQIAQLRDLDGRYPADHRAARPGAPAPISSPV